MKICVVGAGKWGINYINTLSELGVLGAVVEIDNKKIEKLNLLFPELICFNLLEKSFKENFDGYIIATPPSTHADLTKKVLSRRKPVLVEKPLALTLEEADQIYSEIKKYNGKLIVGHLLLFHPAIIKMKSMIQNGIIGDIQYMYSNRLNLGLVRKEENVFWSFAPHDIALFQFFSNSFPKDIISSGGAFLQKNIHDTTMTYIKYANGIQGHIYVSWLHPFKEHRLVIIGSHGTLHFEDSASSKPLLLYEKERNNNLDSLILKNKLAKKIEYESDPPLFKQIKYFIDIIKGQPIQNVSIKEGIDVVKILEMASKSLSLN